MSNAGHSDSPENAASQVDEWQETTARLKEIKTLEKRIIALKQELIRSTDSLSLDAELAAAHYLVGTVAGKSLALSTSQVIEVVAVPALTPLDEHTLALLGLANYHGQLLAVVDLAELLGIGTTRIVPQCLLVLLCAASRRFAVVLDSVDDVVAVLDDDITISDEILPGAIKARGVLRLGDRLALVIDVASIALAAEMALVPALENNGAT